MANERKADRLIRQINELKEELSKHQSKCQHTKGTFEYGSNTGNWCPDDDVYWITAECEICKKRWRSYSEEKEYRELPKKFTKIK